MNRTSYDRVTETTMTYPRRLPLRGFWLKPRRLSIPRLRVRLFCMFRFSCKWKFSYGQALKALKRGVVKIFNHQSNDDHQSLKTRMVSSSVDSRDGGSRTYNYASSFYSDAIKDCLEYIKMSAISRDDENCNIARG